MTRELYGQMRVTPRVCHAPPSRPRHGQCTLKRQLHTRLIAFQSVLVVWWFPVSTGWPFSSPSAQKGQGEDKPRLLLPVLVITLESLQVRLIADQADLFVVSY